MGKRGRLKKKNLRSEEENIKVYYYTVVGLLSLTLLIITVVFVVVPYVKGLLAAKSQEFVPAYGKFFKISNNNYASTPGEVDIYFISWYGSPYGASFSWPLYMLLSHYGVVNVTTYESIFYPSTGYVPGLIFLNFTPNSTIKFFVYYLYNKYLNASANGSVLFNPANTSQPLFYGLNVLKSKLPSWLYNYIVNYTNITPIYFVNATGQKIPVNQIYAPYHVVSTIVITGPGGTYILFGNVYGNNIYEFGKYSPQQLYQMISSGNIPNFIKNVYEYFNIILHKVMGS